MPRRLTPTQRLDREMTEAQLASVVQDLAGLYGWKAVHWRPASNQRGHWATNYQGDGRGFPDWLLMKGDTLLAVELERETARCPVEQLEYLGRFQKIRLGRAFVWRPRHASGGDIARILGGGLPAVDMLPL